MASVAALTELAALRPGDVVVEIVLLPPQLHVPAAHSDVVEEDVAAGMSAPRGRLIQQEPGSGVGALFQDYQRRTRGQPGRIRLHEWMIRSPPPLFPLGQAPHAVRSPCCDRRNTAQIMSRRHCQQTARAARIPLEHSKRNTCIPPGWGARGGTGVMIEYDAQAGRDLPPDPGLTPEQNELRAR